MLRVSMTGLETEYGLLAPDDRHAAACQKVVETARSLAEEAWNVNAVPTCSPGAVYDWMLSNGARLYIDLGHPEYSTPIVKTAEELVAADEAGALLLSLAVERVRREYPEFADIGIFKISVDRVGNSFGSHENYLISPGLFYDLTKCGPAASRFWIPHLVTRIIYTGAGHISTDATGGMTFEWSPRAKFIRCISGADTTQDRALINTRDRPYADAQHFRRLHVITGETNRSPFSTFLKIGVSQLIITMLDQNALHGDFCLQDPLDSLIQVSKDPRAALLKTDGHSTNAIDIQFHLLKQAEGFVARQQLDEQFGHVIQIWHESLDDLQQYPAIPWRSLQRLDWLIKYRLVYQAMKAYALQWGDARLAELDDYYHCLGENDIFLKLVHAGWVEEWQPSQPIPDLQRFPPATTRAAVRGQEIHDRHARIASAWWNIIVYTDGETMDMQDPYEFNLVR